MADGPVLTSATEGGVPLPVDGTVGKPLDQGGTTAQTPPANSTPPTPEPPAAPANTPKVITLTEDQLNERINQVAAKNKRTLQAELSAAQAKASAFDALQNDVSALLQSNDLLGEAGEIESLAEFRDKATETIRAHQTETQRLEEAQRTQTEQLKVAQDQAKSATQRWEQSLVSQAIAVAAPVGEKTVSAGATQLVQTLLAPKAEVGKDGSVTFNMKVEREDGTMVDKRMTAQQAVAHLESDATNYGTLFKSTVSSGAGGQSVDGVPRAGDGALDFASLAKNPEKYFEMMAKNPGAVYESFER